MKRIAAVVVFMTALAVPASADSKVSHEFTNSVAAQGVARVIVDVSVGEIELKTTRGAAQVTVQGVARRDVDEAKERVRAQSVVDNSSVVVRMRGKTAYIEPKYQGDAGSWNTRRGTQFHVTVSLPDNVPVEVDQDVGQLTINGATGDLKVRLDVGEIRLQMPKAAVRELNAAATIGEVRTSLPDRVVTKEGFFAGATNFLNDGGRSTVNLRVRVGEMRIDLTD